MEYQILKKIGGGTYGNVYKARDKDGNFYAIKVLYDQDLTDIGNEVSMLKVLDHPNIIKVKECYIRENKLHIVLPYYSYIFGSRMEEILVIFRTLLEIGYYLEKNKVMHRDIKPDNIIFKDSTTPILIDFGIAIVEGWHNIQTYEIQTLHYRAPEVLKKERYTNKIDVWSMGCTFYYYLKGQHLFIRNNHCSAHWITEFNIDKLRYKLQGTLPSLMDLMEKMLEQDPQKRYSFEQCLQHPLFNACPEVLSLHLVPLWKIKHKLKPNYRAIVMEWIYDMFGERENYTPFILACIFFDHFYNRKVELVEEKGKYQLYACASIFIASQMFPQADFDLQTIAWYANKTYSVDTIRDAVFEMLETLEYSCLFDISTLLEKDRKQVYYELIMGSCEHIGYTEEEQNQIRPTIRDKFK